MRMAKKYVGYLVNKKAIFQADESIEAKYTAFSQYTNTTILIKVIIGQYLTCPNEMLVDPAKLEVVSYHSHNDKIIPDYTKVDGSILSCNL